MTKEEIVEGLEKELNDLSDPKTYNRIKLFFVQKNKKKQYYSFVIIIHYHDRNYKIKSTDRIVTNFEHIGDGHYELKNYDKILQELKNKLEQ